MSFTKTEKTPYYFLVPAFLIITCFLLIPIFFAIILSFTDVTLLKILKELNFIGFDNYANFLTSSDFRDSIKATFIFVVGSVTFSFIVGLLIALLLNQKVRFGFIFKGLLILPWAVPQVVVVLIIKWLFTVQYGLVNYVGSQLGIIPVDYSFFTSTNSAMFVILISTIWRAYPLSAIMLLAGMKSIPDELYESASIDGANPFQKFFHITLPGLKYISLSLLLLLIVWGIGNFVFVWLFTKGGPFNSTAVLAIFSYKNAFIFGDVGYGASIGVIALLFSLIVSVFYYFVFMRRLGHN
jgi:multiple sugar transport system permease protein